MCKIDNAILISCVSLITAFTVVEKSFQIYFHLKRLSSNKHNDADRKVRILSARFLLVNSNKKSVDALFAEQPKKNLIDSNLSNEERVRFLREYNNEDLDKVAVESNFDYEDIIGTDIETDLLKDSSSSDNEEIIQSDVSADKCIQDESDLFDTEQCNTVDKELLEDDIEFNSMSISDIEDKIEDELKDKEEIVEDSSVIEECSKDVEVMEIKNEHKHNKTSIPCFNKRSSA